MAAYAQFGYGYPAANQLIGGVSQSSSGIPTVSAAGNISTGGGSVPSPLSGTNDASLSPSGGSTTTGVTTTSPQSPGAISQTSNNAGSGTANALSTSPSESCAVGGGGGGGSVGAGATAVSTSADGNSAILNKSADSISCCENGRPIMTDPVSGQTVCSCQYDPTRLALGSYPAGSVGVYGSPYPSTDQNPYPSIGVDSSAFYSPLSNPYGMKDNSACPEMGAWTSAGLQPTTGYYSYDPTLAAYGYGPSYDLASRRKNATRESTSTLKAWLNEHKKNPYPTKGEKIMLAIITKMTLTQVSTWFANARRRLKKENKMTWEPKNKTEDDDDGMLSDDEKEKDTTDTQKSPTMYGQPGLSDDHHQKDHNNQHVKSEQSNIVDKEDGNDANERHAENLVAIRGINPYNPSYAHHGNYNPYQQPQHHDPAVYYHNGYSGPQNPNDYAIQKNPMSSDCGIPVPASKPKIWSLADTVACKTPPPTAYPGQNSYLQSQLQSQAHSHLQIHHPQHHNPHPHPHLHHQQPQPQLQPQILPSSMMPQAGHNSPLNMMSNFAGGSPYSRIPTAYTEAMAIHTKVSTNGNDNSSPQQQYQASQHQQRVGGFVEIQPDTPPQTPPNMKLIAANGNPNSSVSLLATQGAAAALATTSTVNMCYNNTAIAQFAGSGFGSRSDG